MCTLLVLGQPFEQRHYAQSMDKLIQQLELPLEERKTMEVLISRHLEDGNPIPSHVGT
jgi:hypothetical protein